MVKIKRQVTKNIEDLDDKIAKLNKELDTLESDDINGYEDITNKLETLTDLRCKLAESRINGSSKNVIVSGVLGIISVGIVLKYEETEVITSKAFNIATTMFRGGK